MFFWNKNKKTVSDKNKDIISQKKHIVFFEQEYDVDLLLEMEASDADNISDEAFDRLVEHFSNNILAIQDKIEEFVRCDYYTIIENYYLGLEFVSHKGKEYQDYLMILKDYNDNTTNALDIVLKNIRPKYFAVISEDKGYFLSDINNSLAYSIDAIVSMSTADIDIKMHDGDFE